MTPSTSTAPSKPAMPRMWDGGPDGFDKGAQSHRDLTNTKLAKNQLVLLEQIEELKQAMDVQAQILERLVALQGGMMNGRAGRSAPSRVKDGEEDQFALGSDDEDAK